MTHADCTDIEAVAQHAVGSAQRRYRSPFGHWESRASVRSRPRRVLGVDVAGEVFFPPELVPVLRHPLVQGLGAEATSGLLVRRLCQYLHFTTELESVAVIPVTMLIARGRSGLSLPSAMAADAFAITTDEAWHAQFSEDLIRQIEAGLGVARHVRGTPEFVTRLEDIRCRLGADLAGVTDLAFSIVSETLISAILADLPRDARLPAAVRDLVHDHALDERRHHAYFHTLLTYFWPALDAGRRRVLGPRLPELINAFLAPDHTATADLLLGAGLSAAQAVEVIQATHDPERVRRDIAAAAATTVRYFGEAGVLADPETLDAFLAAGMLPGQD